MIKKKEPAKKDIADILENYTTETGDDMYVMTGDALPNGEVKAKYFASNQMPRLKAGTDNMKRTLKISFSSVAQDNEQLLHQLFSKTRNK